MSASRWREDRGIALPLVALMLSTLVLMVSFAVDLGRQRSDRRSAQAAADVVALDMMRIVEGRTLGEVLDDPATVTALSESATRNDLQNAVGFVVNSELPRITGIEWGTVPATQGGDSFVAYNTIDPAHADRNRVPTAVRITAERTTDYFFQPGEKGVTRLAIAAFPQPAVDLAVGSVGAGFQPSIPGSASLDATVQALNARLAAHFDATIPNPGSAGFDLAGYRGLAAADVDLRRVAANAGFASPNEMLDSDMSVGQFFDASATALDQQAAEGDPNAAAAAAEMRRFQSQMGVDNDAEMHLGETLDYEQGGDSGAATGSMNVLDLMTGGADVIDGKNFVSYRLSPSIPGVAVANVDQFLVRRQTVRRGLGLGGTATNRQARFQVNIQVAPLPGMSGPLRIPLVVEAAVATGTVDRMDCSDPLTLSEAEIDVQTSGLRVRLGTATDLTADALVVTPAVLVQGGGNVLGQAFFLGLGMNALQILALNLNASLTGSGTATVLGGSSEHVFLPYQTPVAYQRAPGGAGATTIGTQLSSALTSSLALGSSTLTSAARAALVSQLGNLFTNVESLIIDPLLKASGVTVAGADLKATNLQCQGSGLRLVG